MITHRVMQGMHAGHVKLREIGDQKVTKPVFTLKTSSTGL